MSERTARVRELYVRDDLRAALLCGALGSADAFTVLSTVEGEVFRRAARRRTSRIVIAGRSYFVKVHEGVGWREIAKNLLSGKRPVLGARREFEACRRLRARGVPVPDVAAFGERGVHPARRRSFAICDALDGFSSLEDIGIGWLAEPPARSVKRALLAAVGRLTSAIHAAGVQHRDYYACHLMANVAKLARGEVDLAVIDLHRARVQRRLPAQDRVRDLGALLYSTSAMPLSDRDRMRFVMAYAATCPRFGLRRRRFWRAVSRRARRLHARAAAGGIATGQNALGGAGVASVGRLADLGRDPPLPFRFDVDLGRDAAPARRLTAPGTGGVRALCTAVLRAQPSRRLVLRAVVEGRELVIKAFFGRCATRDWMRERDGARALQASGVATPELLGAGRGGGARLLAFEAVDDARQPSVDDAGVLLAALARMHRHNIRQRDLHPGNFLISGGRVFAVDGGNVVVSPAVGAWVRLADVARLLAHFPSGALGPLSRWTTVYRDAAGAEWPARSLRVLPDRVARARRRRLVKFVAKTVRECSDFEVRQETGRRVVVARDDDDPSLRAIIADPERAVSAGEPLKRGNTATAVRCGDFVVKRYGVKGRWHRCRVRLCTSRARRSWRAGHGLQFAGLATPRPRALIEIDRPGVGGAVAYLVLDHVAGERLDRTVDRGGVDLDLGCAAARMFGAWRELRFTHGDTKASNFMVKDGDLHVLDLDAAAFIRGKWRFVRRHRRDRTRFLANQPDSRTFRDAVQKQIPEPGG